MNQLEATNTGGQPPSKCKGCGRQILWLTTINQKKVPVEPQPRTIITEAGDYVKGFEAHFAYCPQAKQFRRPA